jgi:dihydrofolate synthase / folylpolyglutamate synthase
LDQSPPAEFPDPELTYAELVAGLFPRLTGGIRWGLERTVRLLATAGNPHLNYRIIHVGGTNGKGSVAAHLESVLRADGRRTALYSSPHLCTFRERIRIDGKAISEAALLAAARRLWPAIRAEEPSFFEATTAIAMLAMAEAGVEWAVMEVGMGGRLDATNVVNPDVVVLTNVSLDHVQFLGPTVAHVAREKAGIIKTGVPAVTGEVAGTAAEVFLARAAEVGAPLIPLLPDSVDHVVTGAAGTAFTLRDTVWGDLRLRTPLPGLHQATNAALAVRALEALGDAAPPASAVVAGLAATRWAGRLQVAQVAGVTWVFDVAHNVAGMEALAVAVEGMALPRPLVVLAGVLGDKDWQGMLLPLCALADELLLVEPPTAPAERRWDADAVLAVLQCPRARRVAGFVEALEQAQRQGATVLVTGSFHTVGDALAAMGLAPDGADFVMDAPGFLPPSPPAG